MITRILHKQLSLWACLGLIALASCSDDLDITPDGRLTLDEVFANADYTEAYLSGAYAAMPKKMHMYYWMENLPTSLSDESWSNEDTEGHGAIMAYRGQGSSAVGGNIFDMNDREDAFDTHYWTRYWSSIRSCNVFIERIPTAVVRSEDVRKRLEGECRTLRAFYYLQMVKWFGDLPIIDYVVSVDATFENARKQPAVDVLKWIVQECQDIMTYDNLPWRLSSGNETRRMSKAVAAAIASEASLFAASTLYNNGENLWEWAYQVNMDALSKLRSNGYELYTQMQTDNYNSAYGEYFAQDESLGTSPADRETILYNPNVNHQQWYVNGTPLQDCYSASNVPSQELVDSYDMLATGKPVLDLENPYLDTDHLEPNYTSDSGYNAKRPYDGRDPRFDATIIHNKSIIYIGTERAEVRTEEGGNCEVRSQSRTYTRTGYYFRKYHHYNSYASGNQPDGHWKFYRLGVVILNAAEAAAESGHIGEAMELVNEIRHRAGFDPSVDVTASGIDDARLKVRHERRIEMAFEEHRFFDCRRWTTNTEDIECEKVCTGMLIQSGFSTKYTRFVVGTKQSSAAKWHFLPIPLNEVSTLESQTGVSWQNYGW
ncbi:MAG: RagB/SusD family nutrient uptake outer membrane protein [Bacteroidales bacterium]|nr:RagB/SusD family nutrient uptake outer membrane protein [Bacteroidales bacterium]